MRLTQTGARLLPVAFLFAVVLVLATTPASAQHYGHSYGGFSGYSYHPTYSHSLGGGYLGYGYGYPYYHGQGVRYHSLRPYYQGYHYGRYGRGYRSYYGGGVGYGGGGCH